VVLNSLFLDLHDRFWGFIAFKTRLTDMTGSAPDISGQGKVNPIGTILSVAMMLQYSLNLPEEAKLVEEAVKRAIENGAKTADIGGTKSTSEVGDAVVKELKMVLKELK